MNHKYRLLQCALTGGLVWIIIVVASCSSLPDEKHLKSRSYAILDSIANCDNIVIQQRAVNFLRTVPSPESRLILKKLLNHSHPSLRREAVFALAYQGDSTAFEKVIEESQSSNWFIRKKASAYLQFLPVKQSIPNIEPLLQSNMVPIKVAAIKALGALNDPLVLPYLEAAANDSQKRARAAAFAVLIKLKNKCGVPFIKKELQSTDVNRLQEVISYIFEGPDSIVVPLIIPLADHPQAPVRRFVAHVLGSFEKTAVEPVLKRLLKDTDKEVQKIAALSLGLLRVEESIPYLKSILVEKINGMIYWDAIRIAVRWKAEPFKQTFIDLYESEQDKNYQMTQGAILLHFGDNRAKFAIQRIIDEKKDYELIGAVIDGFRTATSPVFIPYLLTIAKNDSGGMRDDVIGLLARYDDNNTMDYFRTLFADRIPGIRKTAVSILGEWTAKGNKRAHAYLLEAMEHSESDVREKAAYFAGSGLLKDSLSHLNKLLSDPDRYIRMTAAWAVLKILSQ